VSVPPRRRIQEKQRDPGRIPAEGGRGGTLDGNMVLISKQQPGLGRGRGVKGGGKGGHGAEGKGAERGEA